MKQTPRLYGVFVGDECVLDGWRTTYAEALNFCLEKARADPAARVRLFVGADIGRLVWDSAEWRNVTV